jgi:hypothetical protein
MPAVKTWAAAFAMVPGMQTDESVAGGASAAPSRSIEPDGDWLAGSEGFRVESPRGRVGSVREIQRDAASGRADALVVRAGVFGTQRLVVPVDEIAGVARSRRLVVLRQSGPYEPELRES